MSGFAISAAASCMVVPKKSLGQHFLHDENIVRKIVGALEVRREDAVVEIGPGRGILTGPLRALTSRFLAIEVDPRAVELLRQLFGQDLEILRSDVRDVKIRDLADRFGRRLRIVGNIPYNITSDILFWLFDDRECVQDATLMVQLEVAQRLTAGPGSKEYGILSVFCRFYADPRLLFRVSANCFHPRPRVESALVQMRFRSELPEHDPVLFRALVRGTFGKRRKTLHSSLRLLGLPEDALRDLNEDLRRRPEQLSVDDFLSLAARLQPYRDLVKVPA